MYALMVDGDRRADEEPLDDGAHHGQQHQEEGEAVAALVLLEGLRPEGAEESADAVREPQPGPRDERRLLGFTHVALGRRGGFARW